MQQVCSFRRGRGERLTAHHHNEHKLIHRECTARGYNSECIGLAIFAIKQRKRVRMINQVPRFPYLRDLFVCPPIHLSSTVPQFILIVDLLLVLNEPF